MVVGVLAVLAYVHVSEERIKSQKAVALEAVKQTLPPDQHYHYHGISGEDIPRLG
jgi:hypothetical protein